MRGGRPLGACLGVLFGIPGFSAAQSAFAYHYEATERLGGEVRVAYSTDFRLSRTPTGVLTAVVIQAAKSDHGGPFIPAAISETCRAAMHGPLDGLAAVQLWPAPTGQAPLGPVFLDTCAPPEVFYPLTDIMNVAIIPLAPKFRVLALEAPGETRRWAALTAQFARFGRRFVERVPGGSLTLVSRSPDETLVDWRPDPADLTIEDDGPPAIRLEGTEQWAFRVGFNPRDAMLTSARASTDVINLVVSAPSFPPDKSPHLKLTRTVSITRIGSAD